MRLQEPPQHSVYFDNDCEQLLTVNAFARGCSIRNCVDGTKASPSIDRKSGGANLKTGNSGSSRDELNTLFYKNNI